MKILITFVGYSSFKCGERAWSSTLSNGCRHLQHLRWTAPSNLVKVYEGWHLSTHPLPYTCAMQADRVPPFNVWCEASLVMQPQNLRVSDFTAALGSSVVSRRKKQSALNTELLHHPYFLGILLWLPVPCLYPLRCLPPPSCAVRPCLAIFWTRMQGVEWISKSQLIMLRILVVFLIEQTLSTVWIVQFKKKKNFLAHPNTRRRPVRWQSLKRTSNSTVYLASSALLSFCFIWWPVYMSIHRQYIPFSPAKIQVSWCTRTALSTPAWTCF